MKEFHMFLAAAQGNKEQFKQLCMDTHKELRGMTRGMRENVKIFNTYYGLNLDSTELFRFARFIKSGKFLQEMENYK